MRNRNLIQLGWVLAAYWTCGQLLADRFDVLLNTVHHNPGEERWTTDFNAAAFLKSRGYTGQVPKLEVQCGLTFDHFDGGVVPCHSTARQWMEHHAFEFRKCLDSAEVAGLEVFPWIDVLVIPKTLMEKYGTEMRDADGRLSILKPMTERVMKAQLDEFFFRYPNVSGVTIRFGETYLHDTPFHCGGSPVWTVDEHARLMNILREEVCVRRGKTVIYRLWDAERFHTQPKLYLDAANQVEPHPLLFMAFKHTNYDFMRTYPMNFNLGRGRHRQIVEISVNQGGCYGKNAHPYYIGKGLIEGWREDVEGPHRNGVSPYKGLRDLVAVPLVAGFWIWNWGDGWKGPYFSNEFWIRLNESVLRRWVKNPARSEAEVFNEYARNELGLDVEASTRFRQLCLLSEDAVYFGQHSDVADVNPWWLRDQYFSAVDLRVVVKNGQLAELLNEKRENLKRWNEIVALSKTLSFPDPRQTQFVQTTCEYGRFKYQIAEIVFRVQGYLAEVEVGIRIADSETAAGLLSEFTGTWSAWEALRAARSECPTLYEYCSFDPNYSEPLFWKSLQKLRNQARMVQQNHCKPPLAHHKDS